MASQYEYGGMDEEDYANLIAYFTSGVFPEFLNQQNKKNARDAFRRKAKNFAVKDGTRLLYVENKQGGEINYRAVVKKGDIYRVIKTIHDADHLGINGTHARVKSYHYWNRLFEDIRHFVSSCEQCQKSGKFETEGSRLKPIPPPRRPFQMWGMDLTMLPKSDEGHNYLVVAVDYLSKYVEAAPLKIKEAPAILTFFDNICSRFVFRKVVITDQGREFCNQLFEDYCNVNGISHRTSTAYHPQVIWRRASDSNPLTVGRESFHEDNRIMSEHELHSDYWNLVIRRVQLRDAGVYECQVSSKLRHLRHHVLLQIHEKEVVSTQMPRPSISISGSSVVDKNGRIYLRCNATGQDHSPDDLDWFIEGNKLSTSSDEKVSIRKFVSLTDRTIVSILEIQNAQLGDSGLYTCRTSNLQVRSMHVAVLNTNTNNVKRGTYNWQTGGSSSVHSPSSTSWRLRWLSAVTLFVLWKWTHAPFILR